MFKRQFCKKVSIPSWLFVVLLTLFITESQSAESLAQSWQGKLQMTPEMSLTIHVHIEKNENAFTAKLDSVDQGAMGIPASKVEVNENKVKIEFASLNAVITATQSPDLLTGTFEQAGMSIPLKLSPLTKEQQVNQAPLRPQEPKGPYPYAEEEVNYSHVNQDFSFAGTLTKPKGKGPFTAVILVSGSGPQDRDANMLNHKPFKVLADHLTRQGFAVLRTDDRGTGQSGGDFNQASLEDFSYDIESAFNYLSSRKDINPKKIGVLGHSEGGMTAPIFAARQPNVAFVISLAGVNVYGSELWATQQRDIGVASGAPDGQPIYDLQYKAAQLAANGASFEELKALFETIPQIPPATVKALSGMLSSKWGHSFMSFTPAQYWSKIEVPVFALTGDLDIQVDASDNLENLRKIMHKTQNKDVTISYLPGLNHLLQKAKTGNLHEYAQISETMNPTALNAISNWLAERF